MTEIQENWQKFKRNEKKMTDNQQKLWEKKNEITEIQMKWHTKIILLWTEMAGN